MGGGTAHGALVAGRRSKRISLPSGCLSSRDSLAEAAGVSVGSGAVDSGEMGLRRISIAEERSTAKLEGEAAGKRW